MQYQIQHILSNPALLKEVPEDVMQNWITQYPYVSLFHLYHLKNKGKYNESDLHKTAFFFNNREKLYYLLNNISFVSGEHTLEKSSETKALTDQQFLSHEVILEPNETIEESVVQQYTPEETTTFELISQQNGESGVDVETQESNINNELTSENYFKDESTNENLENSTLVTAITETQEVSTTLKNEIEVAEKSNAEIIGEQKPLSIADQILLEIQQLKEERARNEKETIRTEKENISIDQDTPPEIKIVSDEIESSANEFTLDEIPELTLTQETITKTETEQTAETVSASEIEFHEIAKPVKNVLSKQQEEVLAKIQSIQEERERQLQEFAASRNNTAETSDHIKSETATLTQIQDNTETEKEKAATEKTLSIQDEVIARIQKIKEEREKQVQEQTIDNVNFNEKEETEVLANTGETESETQKKASELSLSTTSELETVKEQTGIIQTETDSKLSIQDEIIERIRKIQEDRKLKSAEENTVTEQTDNSTEEKSIEEIQNKTEGIATGMIDTNLVDSSPIIDETIKESAETPEEENIDSNDIKIVEKSGRQLTATEIDDTKNPLEEIVLISSTNQPEKEIELIESKILEEIKNDIEDVDVLSEIHLPDTKTEIKEKEIYSAQEFKTEEEQVDTSVILQFENLYPAPLLVKVDSNELFEKGVSIIEKNLAGNITEKDSEKNNLSEPVDVNSTIKAMYLPEEQIQIPEEYPDEAIEHMAIISKDSDLFIPEIEKDKIEEASGNEVISDKQISLKPAFHEPSIDDVITPAKLDDEIIQEPHTFVEWLRILDGNLQIQTADSIKEVENWIEIPRYEIEQSIAHKKEIEKEEQKLFEPNFEEGEVDLFNEIDEEVSKVASESVQFKQDMMTETLAKIYEKQGKKDKALEIYNILLLKFPEKSAYFAGLIEKIEKK